MEIRNFPQAEYKVKEAINTLCANLSFVGGDVKVILVTSCSPQEGKSSISMELMRTMGEMGMKVLLLDADIRASALRGEYDIKVTTDAKRSYPGLVHYLAGNCSAEDIICETNLPNVSMILAGKNVVNSLPLLISSRLEMLMDLLRARYDVIIVDTPPVGAIVDAAKIARCCDGALLVIKSGGVSAKEVEDAIHQMERAGCPILGTVLNEFDESRYGGNGYYKSYYYMPEKLMSRRKKKPAANGESSVRKNSAGT